MVKEKEVERLNMVLEKNGTTIEITSNTIVRKIDRDGAQVVWTVRTLDVKKNGENIISINTRDYRIWKDAFEEVIRRYVL